MAIVPCSRAPPPAFPRNPRGRLGFPGPTQGLNLHLSCLLHGLPTRLPRPWDSPGKNTGVGCHFLLPCRKVKSESEVTQWCPTLSDPMDRPGPSPQALASETVQRKLKHQRPPDWAWALPSLPRSQLLALCVCGSPVGEPALGSAAQAVCQALEAASPAPLEAAPLREATAGGWAEEVLPARPSLEMNMASSLAMRR